MQLKPVARTLYKPIDGVIQNPYIGFVSFNHFRGESLFSNSVDGKEKERYPLYDYIEQNGRNEGFHPDTEVAYIRTLWKDFEPEEGKFNYEFMDGIFEECRKHKQHLMFRLMPHTTRRQEDVPDWLKKIIPCPERPDDKRIKASPESPIFLEKFMKAVEAFGKRYDSDPVLYAVDISLYGAWGEGEGWEKVDRALIDKLMETYIENYKNTFLFGQICAPELVAEANKKGKKLGWRADGCGNDDHMFISFPRFIYPMRDAWIDAPVSFESFWHMAVWKQKGWDEEYIVDQILKWHIGTFNNKSSSIPYSYGKAVERLLCKMGYRFAIRFLEYPDVASAGDTLNFNMWLENRGVAPIHIKHPFTFRLKGENYEKVFDTGIDITKWLPGDTIENFAITLPDDIPVGDYELSAGLVGEYPRPTIKFAFDTQTDGEYYKLCNILIK